MSTIKKAIEAYENSRFGPILGVSDEGSAAQTIADAAYKSAKAKALGKADAMCVGVIIDGERMGSAGEVPIGPDEYDQILPAAKERIFCTTNVGVRVNTRLHQPLPEFQVSAAEANEQEWLDGIFATFRPFIDTPDGKPRPLTIRLLIKTEACLAALRDLVPKLEAGRERGFLGSPELHKLSFLIVFEDEIAEDEVEEIKKLMALAAELGVPEVAIDGRLVEAARRRISIQGLLNVVAPEMARNLLAEAEKRGVALAYHFEVDQETAARTIWTGLDSACKYGLTAAKYGLFPLTLDQQEYVVKHIQRWMAVDWTPIPAFYVDTALVTANDVFESDRVVDAARIWMSMIAKAGAKVALADSPDRIDPHRLLKSGGGPNDRGVLTLHQVETLVQHANDLGLKVLWSGGIKPDQAFELAKLGVAGIFTTGSTARAVAVHGPMLSDKRLAQQKEPVDRGVRRIHALIQAGFLCHVLDESDKQIIDEIEARVKDLLESSLEADEAEESAINSLNEELIQGWKKHWS